MSSQILRPKQPKLLIPQEHGLTLAQFLSLFSLEKDRIERADGTPRNTRPLSNRDFDHNFVDTVSKLDGVNSEQFVHTSTVFAHTGKGQEFTGDIQLTDGERTIVFTIPQEAYGKADVAIYAELGEGAKVSTAGTIVIVEFKDGLYRLKPILTHSRGCKFDPETRDPTTEGEERGIWRAEVENAGTIIRAMRGGTGYRGYPTDLYMSYSPDRPFAVLVDE